MSKRTKQGKCTSGKFKRVNYFHGMLLTEQDFQDEQAYLREKLKLHNRLHGHGVVWGLGLKAKCIEVDTTPKTKKFKIFLEPGFALDCDGNEIIVCQEQLVPIDEKIYETYRSCSSSQPNKFCIGVKYCECKSDPETQYTSQCAEDSLQPNFARVREGFSILVFTEDELQQNKKRKNLSTLSTQDDCCQSYEQKTCQGLGTCCEEDNIIIVGCITLPSGYQVSDPVNLDYLEEYINKYFKPRRACACRNWENVKRKMLVAAGLQDQWLDFSDAAGRSVDDARSYLSSIGFTAAPLVTRLGTTNINASFAEIRDAFTYAAPDAQIELITDKDELRVLFAKENVKRKMLVAAGLQDQWLDFSGAAGRSVPDARIYLSSIGFTAAPLVTRLGTTNINASFAKTRDAFTYAAPNTQIELITDKDGLRVLFAIT